MVWLGNEALVSTAQGRAYGVEALMRWTLPDRLNLTGSFTWYRSEYRADRHAAYVLRVGQSSDSEHERYV